MIGHRTTYLAKAPPPLAPELTLGDAWVAIVKGAALGSVLTTLPLTPWAGPLALLFSPFAFPVWLWGLTCVGVPVWAVLHAGGVRDPRAAALIGAAATFLVCVLLAREIFPSYGRFQENPPLIEAGLAAIGGAVGWFIYRDAYGPSSR